MFKSAAFCTTNIQFSNCFNRILFYFISILLAQTVLLVTQCAIENPTKLSNILNTNKCVKKKSNNYLCRKVYWWEQRVEAVPCWFEFRLSWEGRDRRLHPSASEETWNMLKLILSLIKSVVNVSHSSSFFQLKFL